MVAISLTFARRGLAPDRRSLQFFERQPEPLDPRQHVRPLLREEPFAFRLQQTLPRPVVDVHAEPAPGLHQVLVDELLITLEDRERVDAQLGSDRPHRRQRIAFLQLTLEDQHHHPIAKLPIDGLTVVPFTVHGALTQLPSSWRAGVISNYNTWVGQCNP